MTERTIWILHDDQNFHRACARALASLGTPVERLPRAERISHGLDGVGEGDLVVIDLEMPGASGSGLLDVLRQRDGGLRVLLLSGARLPPETLEPGWRQLTRPFDAGDLLRVVTALLDGERTPRG